MSWMRASPPTTSIARPATSFCRREEQGLLRHRLADIGSQIDIKFDMVVDARSWARRMDTWFWGPFSFLESGILGGYSHFHDRPRGSLFLVRSAE